MDKYSTQIPKEQLKGLAKTKTNDPKYRRNQGRYSKIYATSFMKLGFPLMPLKFYIFPKIATINSKFWGKNMKAPMPHELDNTLVCKTEKSTI